MANKSNIYLNCPVNPDINNSEFDSYLLENNVCNSNNIDGLTSARVNKIPNDRKFKLSDIGLNCNIDYTFITTKSRITNDKTSQPYAGLWGSRPNTYIHNNNNPKIKCNKDNYKYIDFAALGTCPIFNRSGSITRWGTVRYSSAAVYESSGYYHFRYNNGNIEKKLDYGDWEIIIPNRSIILIELQAAGGGGGWGVGYPGLFYCACAGGGSGGSGAYGSFIADMQDLGEITIYVGAGDIQHKQPTVGDYIPSYSRISFKKNNITYNYTLNGGGNGENATGGFAVLAGWANVGAGGAGGSHTFPSTNPSGFAVLQVIDGLSGQSGGHAGGSAIANVWGDSSSSTGNSYSNDVVLLDDLNDPIRVNSRSYGGYGYGGGYGFTQSRGGAASVLGYGGRGSNGNDYAGTDGVRGGGGGSGASAVPGNGTPGNGGDGYLIIH